MWRAVCRVGGPIGTIYDARLTLPHDTIRCTSAACNCIAGIKAAKRSPGPVPVDIGIGLARPPKPS